MDDEEIDGDSQGEEVVEIMKDYDLSSEEAKEVVDLMDELGLDADDAMQVYEAL